ncbi:hypothetical protein [Flavobacterium sp. 22076]|uniref:hypothetical protein n=1 Tax=unclassified Flavobacterium TaxID=196869 RepID=UPI003F847A7C
MYKKWCENVSTLESAIEQIQRDLRFAISKKENTNIYSYTKLLSYLTVCWCEARIMKLIYEPEYTYTNKSGSFTKQKSFSQTEIEDIYTSSTLKDKWLKALQIAISKHHNVPFNINFPASLPFTSRVRYLEIEDLINNQLLSSIELRNRIAHGQWKQAFTNDLKNFSQTHTTALRTENIVTLQLNYNIFKILAQLVHDIASSPSTFNRDFDKNYQVLEQNKLNLHNRNYTDYCDKLVAKYTRGQQRRNSSP